MPAVEEWETFPFEGLIHPRVLLPPTVEDRPRAGRGGVDSHTCRTPDQDFLWAGERWRVRPPQQPSGLPMVLFLEPRLHVGEPGELPDDLAAELGVMIARLDRAIRAIGNVGRVHACRWGDGGEHLHWWFMARPARLPQLVGSFAAIWDDILPPVPEDSWRRDLQTVRGELSKSS